MQLGLSETKKRLDSPTSSLGARTLTSVLVECISFHSQVVAKYPVNLQIAMAKNIQKHLNHLQQVSYTFQEPVDISRFPKPSKPSWCWHRCQPSIPVTLLRGQPTMYDLPFHDVQSTTSYMKTFHEYNMLYKLNSPCLLVFTCSNHVRTLIIKQVPHESLNCDSGTWRVLSTSSQRRCCPKADNLLQIECNKLT